MKALLIVHSFHHHNTEKIAKVIAKVLNAQIKSPHQVNLKKLQKYDLIGFGSGIYDGKFHKNLIDLADKIPQVANKKAFIFSTCGNFFNINEYKKECHKKLKEKLLSKKYQIIDEFICRGWDTNSFLKYFGGINKERPNKKDLERAREFGESLKEKCD